MCSLHMLETLCVMKESILYNNIFNLKTDVHNTKYLTCTYKMCPRERWYQSSLIDTHSGVFNCFWKYVINTKAIGRHIDLKLNWIALMMKLNWVALMISPFEFCYQIAYRTVFQSSFMFYKFNVWHMRIKKVEVQSGICKVNESAM